MSPKRPRVAATSRSRPGGIEWYVHALAQHLISPIQLKAHVKLAVPGARGGIWRPRDARLSLDLPNQPQPQWPAMASPRHTTKELTLPGNGNVVQIDEKLLSGIQRLNELSFTTRFCCQGGSGYAIAYIALEPGKCFPPELQRAWKEAGFEVTTSQVYATVPAQERASDGYTSQEPEMRPRKKSSMQFPPELLHAWFGPGYRAPASPERAPPLSGREQEVADNFCRSLNDWAQGQLDESGNSYRLSDRSQRSSACLQ